MSKSKLSVKIITRSGKDHLFIEIGKTYPVKYEYVLDEELVGYYIGTERNLWLVSKDQVELIKE